MKRLISSSGVRKLTQDEKAILAHPGSRVFAVYFTIMCLGGFLYSLLSKSPVGIIIIAGLAVFVGACLIFLCYKTAWGQEKTIEFDPAFEAVDPSMQQHINNIKQRTHRKLMKKVHIMTPFLLLLFAAPIIGSIVLIDALSAIDNGEAPNIGKFIFSGVCIAYFILFIVVTLILGTVAGPHKKQESETFTEAEGVVYDSIISTQGSGGSVYREQIAVYESEEFLVTMTQGTGHSRGEKVRVRFDKHNPKRCTIIGPSTVNAENIKT